MPSIGITEYPYGHPRNEDYAYDLYRQRKVDMEPSEMSDMGKQIFETLQIANEAARIHIKLGRQQMALEFSRCKNMEEVAALCAKEAK